MTAYLDGFDVDAGTKEVLDLALEMTHTALGLADNFANGIIAKRIIELARAGESATRSVVRRRIEEFARASVRRLTRAVIQAPSLRRPTNGRPAQLGGCIRPSSHTIKGSWHFLR